MKKIFTSSILLFMLALTGCVKNDLTVYQDAAKVEWDAASWNANAVGVAYPFMTRVPTQNAATPTSQPLLTRTTGTVQLRVNLVGNQRNADTEFTYAVSASESTAIAGTHYTAPSGKGIIPANSSFGFVTITILNPGAGTGSVDLVLQLTDNTAFQASVNYAKLGLRIAQN
ncbi:MAG: hypothetical protein RLZZ28_503 [Bacteroidota bacterium]|jgi:hypothetical protein